MPDLGKYGVEVVSAYLATLAILGALLWATWHASRNARQRLENAERRADNE